MTDSWLRPEREPEWLLRCALVELKNLCDLASDTRRRLRSVTPYGSDLNSSDNVHSRSDELAP